MIVVLPRNTCDSTFLLIRDSVQEQLANNLDNIFINISPNVRCIQKPLSRLLVNIIA